MADYDIYVLILCLIVFLTLTATFSFIVVYVSKLTAKLIRVGAEDEKIKTEYEKSQNLSKSSKILSVLDKVFSALLLIFVSAVFVFSLCVNVKDNKVTGNTPTLQVVQSGSMSYVNENNKFVYGKIQVDEHIQTFDVILTHKLPSENDLKVFDIVVYEQDGLLIVHRIVAIEEPDDKHSERYFLLQGDANEVADRFPVRYSQMKGIYKGERIPFVGSFITFMQSPAGYLCVLLIVFAIIVLPFMEKWLNKVIHERLVAIGFITEFGAIVKPTEVVEETTVIEDKSVIEDKPVVEENNDVIQDVVETDVIESEDVEEFNENDVVVTDAEPEGYLDENELLYDEDAVFVDGTTVDKNTKFEKLALAGGKKLTFRQKYKLAGKEAVEKYNEIVKHLYKVKGVSVWEGKACETYKKGKTSIAKLLFKGKTLNAYLALDPTEYENTKYVYTNVSNVKAYANYPMRVKVTSARQVKWVKELIDELAKKKDLSMYAISKLTVIRGKNLPFKEKLDISSDELKERYNLIKTAINSIPNVTCKRSDKHETYRVGNKQIAKIKIVGKTLNVYLNLQPNKFKNTKYIYTDVSNKKAHENYPMRIKVTSARQAKWVTELLNHIIADVKGGK